MGSVKNPVMRLHICILMGQSTTFRPGPRTKRANDQAGLELALVRRW